MQANRLLIVPALLALSVPAAALPDYILMDRCQATRDERNLTGDGTFQPSFALVHILDQATGQGGWPERHEYRFTAYAYENGPNGYPEYGGGDDVCLGPASDQPGSLTYSVPGSAPDAASGTRCLTDSPAGNYTGNLDITATIDASFDLSGASAATLVFFHHHQLRWNSTSDQGWVEVNTGLGWNTVTPDFTFGDAEYNYHLGESHQFKRGEVDLSAFAGQPSVQIRFRFDTSSSSHDDGWFIDDVRLLVDGATVFFDDFEAGTGNWTLTGSWDLSLAGYGYTASLGTIDPLTGFYQVTPIVSPATTGEGVGYNVVRATYSEEHEARITYAKVFHNAPQYTTFAPDLGTEDTCQNTVAVHDPLAPIHRRLALRNAPNPFNPTTVIAFKLEGADVATLRIYDSAGRMVRTLLSGEPMSVGDQEVVWDGRNDAGAPLASGVYRYQLDVGDVSLARSMVMVR